MQRTKKLNNKGFGLLGLLIIVVVLVAVGGAGVYVYHKQHKSKTVTANASQQTRKSTANTNPNSSTASMAFQLPKDWEWYSNPQYGFKLAHPANWGQPKVYVNKGDVGAYFNINFYPAPAYTGAMSYNSRTPINILMQTNDYSLKSCNDGGCRTSTASPTTTSIQDVLNSIANGTYDTKNNGPLFAHDSTSYDIVNTQLPNGGDTTDTLVENKIVSLTKTNVSGAYISYDIVNAPATCKTNTLSDNTQQLCINQSAVNMIAQVADSITTN